jgi:hypothetical protein
MISKFTVNQSHITLAYAVKLMKGTAMTYRNVMTAVKFELSIIVKTSTLGKQVLRGKVAKIQVSTNHLCQHRSALDL